MIKILFCLPSESVSAIDFNGNINNFVSLSHILRETILLKLEALNVNKGADPDEIPSSLLKLCCSSPVESHYKLFNMEVREM